MKYLIEHSRTKQRRTVTEAAWALIQQSRPPQWVLISKVSEEIPPEAVETKTTPKKPKKQKPRSAVKPGGDVK